MPCGICQANPKNKVNKIQEPETRGQSDHNIKNMGTHWILCSHCRRHENGNENEATEAQATTGTLRVASQTKQKKTKPPPARVRHERPPFSTNSVTHVVILDSQTQMGGLRYYLFFEKWEGFGCGSGGSFGGTLPGLFFVQLR